jgi:uncharacterized GH25 family protein
MKKRNKTWAAILIWGWILLGAAAAHAHIFWIEADLSGAEGDAVEVRIFMGHPDAPDSNILMPVEDSQVHRPDGAAQNLQVEPAGDHWQGAFRAGQPGGYVITAARKPGIFDPQWHDMKGPVSLIRDYAKMVLCSGAAGSGDVKTGQGLEIVPLAGPCGVEVGDTLKLRVLREGKPVSGSYSAATSTRDMHDTGRLQSGMALQDGSFSVKIDEAGLWMVLVEYTENQAGEWTAEQDLASRGKTYYLQGDKRPYEVVKHRSLLTFEVGERPQGKE